MIEKINNIISGKIHLPSFCGPNKWQFSSNENILTTESLRPFANDYFHPLNPSFLYEYNSLESMLEFPLITARDGVSTLFDFFQNYPEPKMHGPHLLISHFLSPLIPSSWQNNCLAYNIFSFENLNSDLNKILLFGLSSTSYTNREVIKEKLLSKILPSEVHLMLFVEDDPFYEPKREIVDNCFPLMHEISRNIDGRKVIFHTYESFLQLNDLDEFYFLDLQENNFVLSDNSITQYLLSRGAKPWEKYQCASHPLLSLNLSPYHQLQIENLKPSDSEIQLYRNKLSKMHTENLIANPENEQYFWQLKFLANLLSK